MSLFLFDPKPVLDDTECKLNDASYIVRPLEIGDYDKGYCDLLAQLTVVGNVTKETFEKRFMSMKEKQNTYYIVVIEDKTQNLVITTGSVVVEQKFTHECGLIGHIEDVVVLADYRGQGFGQFVVSQLKLICQRLGCYKIILDCNAEKMEFYKSCGFSPKEQQMAWYAPTD